VGVPGLIAAGGDKITLGRKYRHDGLRERISEVLPAFPYNLECGGVASEVLPAFPYNLECGGVAQVARATVS
jgi:hypothetical protein